MATKAPQLVETVDKFGTLRRLNATRRRVVFHHRPKKEILLTMNDGRELATVSEAAVTRKRLEHKPRSERRKSLRAEWAWAHDPSAAAQFSPEEVQGFIRFGLNPEDVRK